MRTIRSPYGPRQARTPATLSLLLAAFVVAASPLLSRAEESITEKDVINGTMDITFNTRTDKDKTGDLVKESPAMGAQDKYSMQINVAKTTQFSGEIARQPNLYTRTLRRHKQDALITFNVTLSVLNPRDMTQKKDVGKWVGTVPIDTASGAYDLAAGKTKDSPLRIAVDTVGAAQGFSDNFAGKLIGKAEKKDNLASYTYKRIIGDKTQEFKVKKVDPMKFENIELAKGPVGSYPRTLVNGRLDYDYETGNYLTDGITFTYNDNGKETTDTVTGSIKWIEDKDRETTGKGHYELNLRFNEDRNKPTSESKVFEGLSAEESFFVVDNNVPALTGTIDYVDTLAGKDATASKVTYHLAANKLTKQQIMNFWKLWLVAVGPTNDD